MGNPNIFGTRHQEKERSQPDWWLLPKNATFDLRLPKCFPTVTRLHYNVVPKEISTQGILFCNG